jgi:hypothetical protein
MEPYLWAALKLGGQAAGFSFCFLVARSVVGGQINYEFWGCYLNARKY